MKITALTVMMVAATDSAAHAGKRAAAIGPEVTVCTEFAAGAAEVAIAHGIASQLFERIGVNLEWRGSIRCPAGALQISISTNTPADLKPGALAYAMPYEGTHIVVFLDRVRATLPRAETPALLAHVLTHEITHVLEGCSRHSATGVMKAHWEAEDYREMVAGGLPFADEDIQLIRLGMARRESLVAEQ